MCAGIGLNKSEGLDSEFFLINIGKIEVHMPATYEIFKDKRLIIVTCSGPADVDEVSGMLTRMLADPDFTMEHDVLWDGSGRTVPFTPEQVKELARFVTTYRHKGPRRPKRAYVVSKDVDWGMLRVYESYRIGRSDVDIDVFRSREEAMKWIEERD
jgi:hypothetical protein